MGGIFKKIVGSPDAPPPPPAPAPPPPPPTQAQADADVAAQNQTDELRKRRGAAANILTGQKGVTNPNVATKTLLGS